MDNLKERRSRLVGDGDSHAESRSAPIRAVLSGWLSLRTIAFVWLSGCSWDFGAELLDNF